MSCPITGFRNQPIRPLWHLSTRSASVVNIFERRAFVKREPHPTAPKDVCWMGALAAKGPRLHGGGDEDGASSVTPRLRPRYSRSEYQPIVAAPMLTRNSALVFVRRSRSRKFTRLEPAWVVTADEGYDSTSH